MKYKFEADVIDLNEIYHSGICMHAKFVLDKPLSCTSNDLLEVIDGQLYITIGEEHIRLQGRWVDLR